VKRVRIVSLLPSATEILFAVGAGEDVVGVTFECDYPLEARQRTIVSDTALPAGLTPAQIDAEVSSRMAAGEDLYTLDEGALSKIQPDLLVTQDLCSVCAVDVDDVSGALNHLGCQARVVTLDPGTLEEVLATILEVGAATGHDDEATALHTGLSRRLQHVAGAVSGRSRPRVAVLEWTDPPFCAGHWIPDMVDVAGGTCVLGRRGQDSERIGWDELAASKAEMVVVAPCGYHLDAAAELAHRLSDRGQIPAGAELWAVDADSAFVRPGPRLVDGVEALAGIIHPDARPIPPGSATRVSAPKTPANHPVAR
jgi:iron complex transport system substrate-binding protein